MKVHRAIAALVEVTDDLQIIGYASNGHEAVTLCDELKPDVVLMDVLMPVMDGIEATRTILNRHPTIKIIALSSFIDDDNVRNMLKAGAAGFLLKNAPLDDLPRTIIEVLGNMKAVQARDLIASYLMHLNQHVRKRAHNAFKKLSAISGDS